MSYIERKSVCARPCAQDRERNPWASHLNHMARGGSGTKALPLARYFLISAGISTRSSLA